MIDYGTGPDDSDIEVIVFGPGFGESVAVHLGDQNWLLVDSCIDPNARRPAALVYLSAIGVPYERVRVIVASHWHDDHVRGISETARACNGAEFHLSSAFNSKEAMQFLLAFGGTASPPTRGAQELFRVVRDRDSVVHSHQRSNILELAIRGRKIRAVAVSPVQAALSQMIANFAQHLPKPSENTPLRNAVPLTPNMEAMAIHVDFEDGAILLGSDLEEHSTLGWTAVTSDTWCMGLAPASFYKVAHHGSITADAACIWSSLLTPNPHVVATPFNLGRHRLPTPEGRSRILGRSAEAFITSGATRKPQIESSQLKRLGAVVSNLTPVNNGFGAVRMRKAFAAGQWDVTCFGNARRLEPN